MTRGAASLLALLLAAGCGAPDATPPGNGSVETDIEPATVDVKQTVTKLAAGTTPMAERIAVLGLLNKRNGISRDIELRPGQALRVGNVIVRLRACETTAPWEVQQLTGAFVQLDVRNRQNRFERAFSGWLYKETPSLNVVEHPIYDVWPKSCRMTHPGAAEAPADESAPARRRSSAPKSAPAAAAEAPATSEPPPETNAPTADANSAR